MQDKVVLDGELSLMNQLDGEVEKFMKPADGFSPIVDVTETPNGYHIEITDKNGTHTADIHNGTDGDDYVLTEEDKQDIANLVDVPEVPVEDVQINGTSIVVDGVANVPVASRNNLGVVTSRAGDNGIQLMSSGHIATYVATDNDIKGGAQQYRPVAPNRQHMSTFYGLAKSAGDTTQSASSNAVGMYTDKAKAKIQSMLGFGGFELIKTVELTEDSANIEIDTDEAGNAFRLTEFFFIVFAKGSASTSGNNPCYVKNNWWYYCLTIVNVVRPTNTMISGYVKNIFVPSLNAEEVSVCQVGLGGNTVAGMHWNGKMPLGTEHDYSEYFSLYTTGTTKFGAGTVLMLFGRRK